VMVSKTDIKVEGKRNGKFWVRICEQVCQVKRSFL
jgi:hypothetical protein